MNCGKDGGQNEIISGHVSRNEEDVKKTSAGGDAKLSLEGSVEW